MESQIKVVKTITELEKVGNTGRSFLKLEFEDGDSAIMLSNMSTTLKYLNQQVLVSFREDFYQRAVHKFVNEITVESREVTLSQTENIRLYSEESGQIMSTISFKDVSESGFKQAVVFCTNSKIERSDKATWCRLVCLDKDRMSANIRLFDPIGWKEDYNNKYLRLDIKKGKIDFISTRAEIMHEISFKQNPEIVIAKTFIMNTIKDYPEIVEFVNRTKILDYIQVYNVDEDIEPGYEMVRLATEIGIIQYLVNVTKNLNIEALLKNAILRRAYCTITDENVVQSKAAKNLIYGIVNKGVTSKKDMCLIDKENTREIPEKEVRDCIENLANVIIKANRTYFYEDIE